MSEEIMGKQKSRNQDDGELNIWQPATDLFSALLLILMLVILLLGLYLVHIPENTLQDPDAGNTFAESNASENDVTPEPTPFIWMPESGGGDGSLFSPSIDSSATPTISPTISPTPSPTPDTAGGGAAGGGGGTGGGDGAGEGPGDQPDAGLKSAVYVMLVDADTNRTIKEPNVQFELYGENNSLQVLNVYYPERMAFRTYETNDSGTFYLPEKLTLGTYELHQLTEPEGYDASNNIEFILDETYDWADPLVVRVPIYPSRNIIRLQMRDADTGVPLSGGTFDVVAADSIITSDGTLRYHKGQIVCEIVCDEDGNGESEELYLGQYTIQQRVIPDYYAGMGEDIETEVQKRSDRQPLVNAITSTRTKIRLSLKDALYQTKGIGGAVFSVEVPGNSSIEPMEVTTDSAGEILLNELEKGVTYQIKQISSPDSYRLDEDTYTVQVSADGHIGDETETLLEITNHIIRVSIGVTDGISNVQVPDVNLALYTEAGEMVHTWTSTGSPLMFTDLEPGSYYLIKDADETSHFNIQVMDIPEIQNINVSTSYLFRYIIIGGVAAAVLVILLVTIILILRRRKKREKG